MRTYTRVIICAAAVLTLTLAGSPAAQADDASFVRDAQAIDSRHNSENLISTGRSACYFLTRNRHPEQIRERIARYLLIDMDEARSFLVLSAKEYCPQFGDRVGV